MRLNYIYPAKSLWSSVVWSRHWSFAFLAGSGGLLLGFEARCRLLCASWLSAFVASRTPQWILQSLILRLWLPFQHRGRLFFSHILSFGPLASACDECSKSLAFWRPSLSCIHRMLDPLVGSMHPLRNTGCCQLLFMQRAFPFWMCDPHFGIYAPTHRTLPPTYGKP